MATKLVSVLSGHLFKELFEAFGKLNPTVFMENREVTSPKTVQLGPYRFTEGGVLAYARQFHTVNFAATQKTVHFLRQQLAVVSAGISHEPTPDKYQLPYEWLEECGVANF